MKIRIAGACGSGKSYLARELSRQLRVPYYETDNWVWDRRRENTRFSVQERDAQLEAAVGEPSWIIEGVHYKWGQESFAQADLILLLDPGKFVRDCRVVRRFIRTRFGLEQANYKQSFKNLRTMLFEWNRDYDKTAFPDILELTAGYAARTMVIKNARQGLERAREEAERIRHQNAQRNERIYKRS